MFLPEGVSPASGHLQSTMMQMFGDFTDWSIVIFDNVLLLAHDEEDAIRKTKLFLERCEEHNVILKMQKSWFGSPSVKFFGYKVSYGKHEMDEDRKKVIDDYVMPTTTKGMQSFLGAALFFKSHVGNFSDKSANLYKMTQKNFNWDRSTWLVDYEEEFKKMKEALSNSVANHFPDYELDWTLRVDASKVAVGAVLYQTRTSPDSQVTHEAIGFASKKFSDVALRWDTMKKESYACFFGIEHFAYYLRGKSFILETDHRNILWIEKSDVPIIVRWRLFMQSFVVYIRHIPGLKNKVADWLSRLEEHFVKEKSLDTKDLIDDNISCLLFTNLDFSEDDIPEEDRELLEVPDFFQVNAISESQAGQEIERVWTPAEMFAEVHGDRHLHFGVRRTWLKANKRFPGHKMRYDYIEEMVTKCANCQKNRRRMVDYLEPIVRHLKVPNLRKRIGIDNLTVTPVDKNGNGHILVIVNHFSKHVWGMPASRMDEITCATALLVYVSLFGLFEEIWSDPGSDFMSKVVKQFNAYLGMKHVISIVDRHTSCGVEGPNKQILRHLKALVQDERAESRWSDPIYLSLVFFVMNDEVNSETGYRPMDLMFGSEDGPYLRLPDTVLSSEISETFVKTLDANLKEVRSKSRLYQEKLAAERVATTPLDKQNVYHEGELILWQRDPTKPLPNKLAPHFKGPYKVIRHTKNDVECRHLVMKNVCIFDVSRVKMFHGSEKDGYEAAKIDADQANIVAIYNWRNSPTERKFMDFLIEFEDRSPEWIPWSPDLDASIPFGEYVMRERPLFLLRTKKVIADKQRTALNRQPITDVQPADRVYVDIRKFGEAWAFQCGLPGKLDSVHVLEVTYTRWQGRNKLKIFGKVLVWDEEHLFDHYEVYCYGTEKILTERMILIDDAYTKAHPTSIPEELRAKVLRRIG